MLPDVIGQLLPPTFAFDAANDTVELPALMLWPKREECVDVEPLTFLNDRSSDQTTLSEANYIDLLVCEVGVIVQPVANLRDLPIYGFENRRNEAITNLHALNQPMVINGCPDPVFPLGMGALIGHI